MRARLRLRPGDAVLDLCCGAGASGRDHHAGRAGRPARGRLLGALQYRGVRAVRTNVVFGTARRPG